MMGRKRKQRGLEDSFFGVHTLVAFRVECEVHDHDAVLLDDADQQDDADDGNHIEILMKEPQCEQCANTSRRQRGEDRDGMDEALIQGCRARCTRRPERQE
jgi:hypothetical protein